MVEGRRLDIHGIVQGVGFRPFAYRVAQAEGVCGRIWNNADGVVIDAFGAGSALDRFQDRLLDEQPAAARISALSSRPIPVETVDGFEIVASTSAPERRVSIPPDLATCRSCEQEIRDATNRRYRYAFTNCTDCGPRFTIALDVPYDRPNTTMERFVMCPACQCEYDTVNDRRFHAQANACPVCGPALTVHAPNGELVRCEDAIAFATDSIRSGLIVAVKGIGGFHLACDATSAEAVQRLRERKRRDEKPFAVMVRTLADAHALALIGPAEEALLTGAERPIVLLTRREPSPLAASIAPGNPLVGLMLPYSPLHHLLLGDAGRPLVMTSGNVSDEPIAFANEEALARLGPLADLFLLHDREIVTRCDDSVARVIGSGPVVLRRSRGYVPRPVRLARPLARPVLACGALLKNTFCLARGDEAFFGPHIGDLDHLETYRSFETAIERMQRFLDIQPEVIAYDLHPGYHSTRYALCRDETVKVGVQHHHAHLASLMGESGVSGPMLGVVYDGTGYGLDGTAWGGEILLGDEARFERIATFRPLALAGGDAAVRAPWRAALSLLLDAFAGDPPLQRLAMFDRVSRQECTIVRQMLEGRLHVAQAHGVGRYFDAVGALVLGKTRASYEGQVAMELNAAADETETAAYPFDLQDNGALIEIDLRRGVRALVEDLIAGDNPARISARFHRTIGCATAEVVGVATARHGRLPIGLTGGCFQNALLVTDVIARLAGHAVHTHREVPPGDGGIALGQALVADTLAARYPLLATRSRR